MTEKLEFIDWRQVYTRRYEQHIYQRVLSVSVEDLTELETEQLEQLLNQSACLRIAYEMKEEFREIYETNQTVQSGLNRMKKWLAQAQVFYPKAVQTIRAHLEGICNYFISRTKAWSDGGNQQQS